MGNEAYFLATLGARAVLDRVMVEKVGDRTTFALKIGAFVEAGFATSSMRDPLLKALDAGSAAMHRGYNPTRNALNRIIDILEVILQTVYLSPEWAMELERATPKRPASNRANEVESG